MTLEQEVLITEALTMILAGYPKFICKEATRIRKELPDIPLYAGRTAK